MAFEEIDLSDFHPDLVEHLRTVDDPRIRYKFRARTTGMEEYICPFCGYHNRFKMTHSTWSNRCIGASCRRYLGIGRIGYVIADGRSMSPPDLVIPDRLVESYPEGDLARWKSGQTIHEVRMIV